MSLECVQEYHESPNLHRGLEEYMTKIEKNSFLDFNMIGE